MMNRTGYRRPHPRWTCPALHDDFRALLDRENYYTRYELPRLAAQSLLAHWPEGAEPFTIYYLPHHPSSAELELMQALLQRGRCRGDHRSDRRPVRRRTDAHPA